jgi:hypothetical protein
MEDILPKQTPEHDYNCGIGVVAAVGIMHQNVIGVNLDDNFKFATIFSKKTSIVSFCKNAEEYVVRSLRILSEHCHPLMKCQFLGRRTLLF